MTMITRAKWEAMGHELYGDNKQAWRFECPMCHNVQSVERAKREWPELEGMGWQPWAECIGRYLEGRGGCDWAAYGLFRGPLEIDAPEQEALLPAFDFAQRDYEAKGLKPLHGFGL